METLETLTRIKTYSEYKATGVKWLHEIPSHWSLKKGKWLFVKQERAPKKEDEIVTCFRDGQVTLRSNRKTEGFTNALKEHGYQGIRKGDLVIHAMDAFAGAIGVSDSDGKSTPVYAACVPRAGNSVDVYYYAYFLRNLARTGFIESLAKGIRERSTDFRFNDFGILVLPVPPKPEQTLIARFLDRKTAQIDKAIGQKEKLIELLKERRQILIHNAVTIGLNPNVRMKDSGVEWIGKIPEHWELLTNRSLFEQRNEAGNEKLPLLSVSIHSAVSSEELSDEENIRGKIRIEDKSNYKRVMVDDITYNMMRAWQGAIGSVRVDGMVSPAYVVAKPKRKFVSRFVEYQYRTNKFIQQMDRASKGITDFRKRLYWDEFKQLFTILPPIEEQIQISEFIEASNYKTTIAIGFKEKEIGMLKEYKATLINSAVTGKIKVTDFETMD